MRNLFACKNVNDFNVFRKKHRRKLPSLYKFSKPTYHAIRNLELKQIYLSQPKDFNDPMDSKMAFTKQEMYYSLIQSPLLLTPKGSIKDVFLTRSFEEFENMPNKPNDVSWVVDCINQNYNNKNFIENYVETRNFFRISCFTERVDSSPMWSYYTDDHKGFCVKYNFTKLYDENILNYLYPVGYSETPCCSGSLIGIKKHIDDYKNGCLDMQWADYIDLAAWACVIKATEWKHENEWRFVISQIYIDEYFNKSYQVAIPARCIERIILGVKTETIIKEHLTEIAKTHKAELYQADFIPNSYKMDMIKLYSPK